MSGFKTKLRAKNDKNESDEWFLLKQRLAGLMLKDIKQDWEVGNIPSVPRKVYEMRSIVNKIIENCPRYLKELGEIRILWDNNHENGIILEREMLERWGIEFDQGQEI